MEGDFSLFSIEWLQNLFHYLPKEMWDGIQWGQVQLFFFSKIH